MLGQHTETPLRAKTAGSSRPLLQIKLTPEVLQQILASSGKGLQLDLDGKALVLGASKFPYSIAPEATPLEVYTCPRTTQDHLDLVGRVSHKVTVRRELAGAITEKLKTRNAEEKAAKENRSVQQLEVDPLSRARQQTKPSKLGSPVMLAKGRQSPFLQTRKSPLLVASSPKLNAVPLKTKLVQMLAIGAATMDELSGKLRSSTEALQPLLAEIGRAHGNNEWSLKDEGYSLVKIWDWRAYTTAERTQVISRATEAFDRLKLPSTAAARLKLVHPEKRTAMSDSERSDTSPLSLNAPITAAAVTSAPKSKDVGETRQEAKKAVTANGILSTGKGTKQRKTDNASTSSAEAHSDADQSIERRTKRADEKRKDLSRVKPESSKLDIKKLDKDDRRSETKVGKCASDKRERSRSRSRLQTLETKAPSLPNVPDIPSLEQAIMSSNRTSSMTSTSTDRSSLSVATAATSTSEHSPIRKNENKQSPKSQAGSTAAPVTKKSSIFDSKRLNATKATVRSTNASPAVSVAVSTTKRKAAGLEDSSAPPAKRAKFADLVELAQRYKTQYPQYQALHAQYADQMADEVLKAKFVKMHHEMKVWKEMLWAASTDGSRNGVASV